MKKVVDEVSRFVLTGHRSLLASSGEGVRSVAGGDFSERVLLLEMSPHDVSVSYLKSACFSPLTLT